MKHRSSLNTVVISALAFGLVALHATTHAQSAAQTNRITEHWVGTWATAMVPRLPLPAPQNQGAAPGRQDQVPPGPAAGAQGANAQPAQPPQPPVNFSNQTIRQIVHTSVGGDRVRVVLSNAFGTAGLAVGAAHIALRDKDAAIVAKSDHPLTFGGSSTVTIPAGAVIFSDPVALTVPALGDLAIDLYLPGDTSAGTSPLSTHNGGGQTNYVSVPGDHTGKTELPVMTMTQGWYFLARVEVTSPAQVGAVVTIGDSITNGGRTTADTNRRWPDDLARRLNGPGNAVKVAVLNVGIAGNRVLGDGNSALARFERDVLAQTGVTSVIVAEGVNDIGGRQDPPTAEALIAGHEQLIERAHARGLLIYGATVMPAEGSQLEAWNPEKETKRQALNKWIRTSHAYDAVIDFDAVVRDPNQPTKILAKYDSGDNLHPNDAGHEAMANAIDLALFKPAGALATRTSSR